MRKRIFVLGLLSLVSVWLFAQSQYISYRELPQEDRKAELLGASGVLIYSQQSDLIITLTNVSKPLVKKNGKLDNGLYEYEVIIEPDETPHPKFEITRRGKVDRQTFLAKVKPDHYKAYLIEEVANPIRLEDQTRSQDVILDEHIAAVEIESALPDLQVEFSDSLQAEMKTAPKKNDPSVFVITLMIPVARLQAVTERLEEAVQQRDALYQKLVQPNIKLSADDEQAYDELEQEVIPALETLLREMSQIEVYAEGSNHLMIDITGISARVKKRYGILLLHIPVHITECGDLMSEAARLLESRNYEEAKQTFQNALQAKDVRPDMIPVIQSNIADCDSCILYDKYAKHAARQMQLLKKQGEATQDQVKEYASAAMEFMQILNNYNPCEYYELRIQKLAQMIDNLPLVIRFSVHEWVRTLTGFHIGDGVERVELWANHGLLHPDWKAYNSEKRFRKTLERSNFYFKVGETDEKGMVVLNLDRKSLPKGLFFHAPENRDLMIEYVPMQKIIRDSKNDYKMRQYRLRMSKQR